MKPFICLIFVLLGFSNAFSQQPPPSHRLTGVIRDKDSAVIPGLLLEIDKGKSEKKNLITDINGEFEVFLTAGNWELTAARLNKQSFRVFLKISETELIPAYLELTLESSLLCCTNPNGTPYAWITSFPKPAYPPAARAVRAEGQVVVNLKIGKDGKVMETEAESGPALLITPALSAARGCRFVPSGTDEIRTAKVTYYFISLRDEVRKKPVNRYKDRYTAEVSGGVNVEVTRGVSFLAPQHIHRFFELFATGIPRPSSSRI